MSKQKTIYQCSSCNYSSVKWLGCCPHCNQWDCFVEQHTAPSNGIRPARPSTQTSMISLHDITTQPKPRMCSGIYEWDRVMGGGIMPSSLMILTGDPGIGKSTLLLQISHALAQNYKVFYCSTEESLHQVKIRAERLACDRNNLLFSDHADLSALIAMAQAQKPDLLIIDSIQNCFLSTTQTAPGSISQLRESTFQLMRLAKEEGITIIITGHITKEGIIAGPKTLEHMVDAVFYLQGEERWNTRILRAVKNRFGTINELGFFEMHTQGLIEMPNINEHLLKEASHAPGSVLISVAEGSRPLLLELQALTIESKLAIPQRVISGVDHKQVVLIAAILEKYLHIKLSMQDIFFKVSGGFKIKESSTDLGIACALLSSYFKQPLPKNTIILGELSLTGTIKPVNQINLLIKEANKFGIQKLLVAHNQAMDDHPCTIHRFQHVYELLSLFSDQ